MAYIIMPLIFTIVGYALIAIAFAPVIDMAVAVGDMVISQTVPDFSQDFESIFVPPPTQDPSVTPFPSVPGEGEGPLEFPTISVKGITIPKLGNHYAQLSCERIGLSGRVFYGDDNAALRRGIGQFAGTLFPGFGSPILLSAHNTTYFKPLRQIEVGDVIDFTTSYGFYKYEVTEIRVANKNDSSAYDLSAPEETLILYTCYPFEVLSYTKSERLFVYAKRIAGPNVAYRTEAS